MIAFTKQMWSCGFSHEIVCAMFLGVYLLFVCVPAICDRSWAPQKVHPSG